MEMNDVFKWLRFNPQNLLIAVPPSQLSLVSLGLELLVPLPRLHPRTFLFISKNLIPTTWKTPFKPMFILIRNYGFTQEQHAIFSLCKFARQSLTSRPGQASFGGCLEGSWGIHDLGPSKWFLLHSLWFPGNESQAPLGRVVEHRW